MRIFKPLITIVLAVAFLVAGNAALTFALEPYGSRSELVWTDFQTAEDTDTLLIGTSLIQQAVEPELLDELYGSHSYTLATPIQTLEETRVALQTACEDRPIKRVILGLSTEELAQTEVPSLGMAFLRQHNRFASLPQVLRAHKQILLDYGAIAQPASLNAAFPWIYNHVDLSPSLIMENIQSRLHDTIYEAEEKTDLIWDYTGKGHGVVHDTVFDYDLGLGEYFGVEELEYDEDLATVNPDRARTLRDICAYCNDNGIDLVVVMTPLPVFNVISGENYLDMMEDATAICAEQGVEVYDFNLVRPEFLQMKHEYYCDTVHVNEQGGIAFTKAFAKFLAMRDAGEDLSKLFFDRDELLRSIDYIDAVYATATPTDAGVHVEAQAITGPEVDVEYSLATLNEQTGEWTEVSGWQREGSFDFRPEQRGPVVMHVRARQVGDDRIAERYRELRVLY